MNANVICEAQKMLISLRQALHQKPKEFDIDLDGDETDEIQAKQIANVQSTLTRMDREKLIRIDIALTKIANSSFGLCEECEEEISEKRLLANPTFDTCITCAEMVEMEQKRKR